MLQDQTLVSAVWTPSAARFVNTTGTPIFAVSDAGTGEAIADEYSLTLSAVAGGTGTVTVGTQTANNPYKGRVVAGVALNSATVYTNIIPGINVTMTTGGANGNVGTVYVGIYAGTFDAFGGGAGTPSAGVRHRAYNTGTGAVANSVAELLTMAKLVRKVGSGILAYVRPFADGATEKVTGGGSSRVEPYHITVANVTGTGSAKVADLQVDGVTLGAVTILDLTTGTLVSGSGLKAISPAYPYRIITGPLFGLEFALSASVANGDTANVLIFNTRYVQIAPDVGGVAGTYGVADVVLTQAGQGAGVIQPTGEAFYWVRILVPAGANSESNPYPGDVALSGTETGAANWNG